MRDWRDKEFTDFFSVYTTDHKAQHSSVSQVFQPLPPVAMEALWTIFLKAVFVTDRERRKASKYRVKREGIYFHNQLFASFEKSEGRYLRFFVLISFGFFKSM